MELLRGITGAFRPGVLTALMGASGAGKVTGAPRLACFSTSIPMTHRPRSSTTERKQLQLQQQQQQQQSLWGMGVGAPH